MKDDVRWVRKRPVVVATMELQPLSVGEVYDWITGAGGTCTASGEGLLIRTLEGTMTASWGDWIIRGVKGEFYPCKPDILAETYEDAAPPAPEAPRAP